METAKNIVTGVANTATGVASGVASTASRAIWGDGTKDENTKTNKTGGTEPISGKIGDVKAGEPYDKGNDETITESSTTTAIKDPNTSSSSALGDTSSTGPVHSEHETSKTGVTSPSSIIPDNKPTSLNENSGPGAAPSVGAGLTSNIHNADTQQGTNTPKATPDNDATQRIKETKQEAEDASKVGTSGPGPKTLDDKSKIGGIGGASIGVTEGLQKESHGTGTGEKYVKSHGLVADGGDFDASNPGAGKEADRLLEEKGVHHSTPTKSTPASVSKTSTPDSKADTPSKKLSLGEKIKSKLHRHKKSSDVGGSEH